MADAVLGDTRPAIPAEVDRWNWGAFLLNWIWGIGNGTPIALLTLIPFVGFVMIFVLGAKGSAWAWQNARWDSVEHFRRVQRKWAFWGVVVWLAWIGLAAAGVGSAFYALRSSEAYRLGVAEISASPEVQAALGAPISAGFPSGQIHVGNGAGEAALTFSVTGPKGAGAAALTAVKANGVWTLEGLQLKIDGRNEPIVLRGKTSA